MCRTVSPPLGIDFIEFYGCFRLLPIYRVLFAKETLAIVGCHHGQNKRAKENEMLFASSSSKT